MGILGHNGAGKSTFSRCFRGLEKRRGTVTVNKPGAVITYTAGYEETPYLVRQAMLLLIGHWYTNREAVIQGSTTEIDIAVRAMLNQYKGWWF